MHVYGDRREKLERVGISVKHFDLKRGTLCYKDLKTKKQKKIQSTDPTLNRMCEGKQAIIFFWPYSTV